jgi:acetolactate synthase small subunit
MSEHDPREGTVLATFRAADDHRRAIILGRKIESVQISVCTAVTALHQVLRQVNELVEYQAVLEAGVSDPGDRKVVRDALLRQYESVTDEGQRAKLLELAQVFGAEIAGWL